MMLLSNLLYYAAVSHSEALDYMISLFMMTICLPKSSYIMQYTVFSCFFSAVKIENFIGKILIFLLKTLIVGTC